MASLLDVFVIQPRRVWVVALGVAGASVAPTWVAPSRWDEAVAVGGMTLQLAGLLIVFWQLTATGREHGAPSLHSRIEAWSADLANALGKPRSIKVELQGTAYGVSGAAAELSVTKDLARLPVDEQIEELARRLEAMNEKFDRVRLASEQRAAGLETRISANENQLETETRNLADAIRELAVGDLAWAYAGAWLTAAGMIIGAWPQILALFEH